MNEPLDLTELRVLSDLVSRAKLAGSAGMQFGTDRDLYTVLGYKQKIQLKDYRDRYERGGIASRIVEAFPQATWQEDPVIVEDDDPEVSTPFEEIIFELQDRLQIWSQFKKADVLAGLGQYSVILIGAPGNLESPITSLRPDQILYLSPFGEQDVTVESVVEKVEDERFGQPELYKFKRVSKSTKSAGEKRVHWTRVLHFADGVLDEQFRGTPRLQKCWNYLDDLDKVVGGGSEAFWIRVNPGTQFDLDKDVQLTPAQLDDLQEKTEEFYHGIKRMIRTRGVSINQMQASVAAFNAQVDALLTLVSATTGIPKRILMGSERGELASTQDRTNWAAQISDRQTQVAGPQIVRKFIDRLIMWKTVPEPEEYDVRWHDESVLNDDERSTIALRLAEINAKAGEVVITGAEIRDMYLGLEPLPESADPEEVDEMEEDLEEENPDDGIEEEDIDDDEEAIEE